jgi:hypothetical protein
MDPAPADEIAIGPGGGPLEEREMQTTVNDEKVLLSGLQSWWTAVEECHDEVLDFIAMRDGRNGEALHDLCKCRDWSNAFAVQSRWMREAARDYSRELGRMLALLEKYGPDAAQTGGDRPTQESERLVPGFLFY